MSSVEEVRYTCDRCKGQHVSKRGTAPSNWADIEARYSDRSANGRGLTIYAGDLCNDCRLAFMAWWEAGKPR